MEVLETVILGRILAGVESCLPLHQDFGIRHRDY
jgi:hypothetical protein